MSGISRKTWLAVALIVTAMVLMLAWIDGGEEEIELIVDDIALPENAR